jgi:hypothetical protein
LMSGANDTESTSQPSKEEMLLDAFRRLKTHSPIYTLPRLIMTQQLHQMMGAARQRVNDGHRHIQHLMGEEVGDDEDGNISLQGDTTTTIHNHKTSGLMSSLLPVLLAAGLGAAALPAWDWWCKRPTTPPAVVQPAPANDDWKLGLEVRDTP